MSGNIEHQKEAYLAIESAKKGNAEELFLSQLHLDYVPDTVKSLKNVRSLYLFNNNLTEIPTVLCELTKLERLYISSNKLERIPESINRLQNLRILDLKHNKLIELPDTLVGLRNLKILYLSNNQFEHIPDCVYHLKNLEKLDLKNNQIETLKSDIGQLKQLDSLDISFNQLIELPEEIGQLSQLKKLHIQGNKLSGIPASMRALTQLNSNITNYEWERGLRIEKNHFFISDPSLFEKEPRQVIEELLTAQPEQKESEPVRTTNEHESKIVEQDDPVNVSNKIDDPVDVSGDRNMLPIIQAFGESEYRVFDYLNEWFDLSDDTPSTFCISIENQTYSFDFYNMGFLPLESMNEKAVQYPNAIRLIVLNEMVDLPAYNSNNTIVLVRNGTTDYSKNILSLDHEKDVQSLHAFIEDFFKKQINHPTSEEELLWRMIRGNNDIIDHNQWHLILEENHINNKLERTNMLRQWIEKGYVYRNTESFYLSDFIVVNKLWFFQQLKKLFSSIDIARQGGVVSESALMNVFAHLSGLDKQYIIHLIQELKWCYPLRSKKLLFPYFLGKQSPEMDWNQGNEVVIKYTLNTNAVLNVLYSTLFEYNEYIIYHLRWETGYVFQYQKDIVWLEANPANNTILVRIKGVEPANTVSYFTSSFQKQIHSLDITSTSAIKCPCVVCQTSETPSYYQEEHIHMRKEKGYDTMLCQQSFHDVQIKDLFMY